MAKEIILPEGWEVDKIESGKIILKEVKFKYPKTWEECASQLKEREFINTNSKVCENFTVDPDKSDINFLPSGYGKKVLALCQLLICRNAYWGDWRPKLLNRVHVIMYGRSCGKLTILKIYSVGFNRILCFPTEEMRDTFYENFKDLIEEAKELL